MENGAHLKKKKIFNNESITTAEPVYNGHPRDFWN